MANETCSQCGKIAVANPNDHPLCVSCYYKLSVAQTLQAQYAVIIYNNAAEQADSLVGFSITSKMQMPQMPKAPLIMNNIDVKDSVVGSINTGNVHTVDVNITYLEEAGNKQIAEAIQKLTQAIVDEQNLDASAKNDLLEQVAYLSEQASAAAKDRKTGMVKATVDAIKNGATAVTSLKTIWDTVEPIIHQYFPFLP